MDIHKPRPWHGWREFLKEVGIIVLGVLIALGAEQVVAVAHDRQEVEGARGVIARELAHDGRQAVIAMRFADCKDQRLDGFGKILDRAAETGRLPPTPLLGRPRLLGLSSSGWTGVIATPTGQHLPRVEVSTLELAYLNVARADQANRDELAAWTELYAMSGPGRPITPPEIGALRSALGRARSDNILQAQASGRVVERAAQVDLPFTAAERADVQKAILGPPRDLDTGGACVSPPTEIPANYGQTPLADLLDENRKQLAAGVKLGRP
jgi:hypothetical protein